MQGGLALCQRLQGKVGGETGALGASQSQTVCGSRYKSQAGSRVLSWQRGLLGQTMKENPLALSVSFGWEPSWRAQGRTKELPATG